MKEKEEISEDLYKKLKPQEQDTQIPRIWGAPKIHKDGNPLREIVDSTGSITTRIQKYIASILKTYVGKSEYHIENSKHFVESIKDQTVGENETLVSYDVKALYPSVPQDQAIDLIHQELQNDVNLRSKTEISSHDLINLFKICVKKTFFAFNQKLYVQVDGLAIGASTSGFAADIFMYHLEKKALATFENTPTIWKRFVDDTFAKIRKSDVETFLTHLNNQHPRIPLKYQTN